MNPYFLMLLGFVVGLYVGISIANKGPKGNDMNPEEPYV